LNYRHAFHAGNYADVLKHALLVQLVRALQRKERGFVFVDTHAGRGGYDLSLAAEGDARPREPEWPRGIGSLWDRTDAPAALQDYVGIVRAYDRSRGNLTAAPRFYPGSPRIARLVGRPQDRLELWERQPAECAALRSSFEGERRVSIHEADGYGAMRACLPPAERRALVLVDPPYEEQGEWAAVADALGEGLRRFAAGTFAVWYPLTGRARATGFIDSMSALDAPSLAAELVVDPGGEGMRGCGVVVANPPWRFDDEARSIVAYLAEALPGAGSEGSVRWISTK
jgi:23S rRNA (adenine2030-N6)-methyltransferase